MAFVHNYVLTPSTMLVIRPIKGILFLPEIRVTKKICTWAAANLFISSILLRYYLFFFSFFWFICILAFLLLVCCFSKLKICILIHIRLCGRVSDKKMFAWPISGNKTTFFFALTNSCFWRLAFLIKIAIVCEIQNNSWATQRFQTLDF